GVDPRPARQGRRRLRADHAHVQGAGQRGRDDPADRVHQEPARRPDPDAHRGGAAARRRAAGPEKGKPAMTIITTPFPPQGVALAPTTPPGRRPLHYLNAAYGVRSWLLTTDHKRIALLYLVSLTMMFIIGGLAATLIRLDLLTPSSKMMHADTYN